MEDPFIIAKNDCQTSVNAVFRQLERWKKLSSGTSNVAKQERTHIEGEIRKLLNSINEDVADLELAINAVESDRFRFNLSQDEVSNRKYFIQQTKDQCRTISNELSNPRARDTRLAPNLDRYTAAQQAQNRNNDVFLENNIQEQQQIIQQQDDQLNLVGQSIGRIKEMGRAIGDEVDDQNELLDEFHNDMGQTQQRMSNVQKKVDKILEKVDGKKQNVIIGVLLVVMIIVVILFFST